MNRRPGNERLKTFGLFLRTHQQVWEALNRNLLEERGISLSWYDVLLQLSSATDGRLRLQDLADRVLYSRSGLTRLVDRMEAAGLVMREPCSHDKRGTFAVLTPEGRRVFRRAAPTHLRAIEENFFSHLSDTEINAVGHALARVLKGVRRSTDAHSAVSTP